MVTYLADRRDRRPAQQINVISVNVQYRRVADISAFCADVWGTEERAARFLPWCRQQRSPHIRRVAPSSAKSRASLVFFWPNNKCGMPHVWRFS